MQAIGTTPDTSPAIEDEDGEELELEKLMARARSFAARLGNDSRHRLAAIYAVEQVLKLDDELSRRRCGYGILGLARDIVWETTFEGLDVIAAIHDLLNEIDHVIATDIELEDIGLALRAAALGQSKDFVGPFVRYAMKTFGGDAEGVGDLLETAGECTPTESRTSFTSLAEHIAS